MIGTEIDHVVVITDARGHRRPFGPARDRASADQLAARLRQWGMHATAERGRVVHGEFIAADDPAGAHAHGGGRAR